LRDQLLVIDGERLRGISDNEHIKHFVELFSAESGIIIAQERVPDKSCERAALPALLKVIDVKGTIISMDAHYTYMQDLRSVLKAGDDCPVGIKGNQGNLEAEVKKFFEQANAIDYEADELECSTTLDKRHGRIETQYVCVTHDLDWLPKAEEWGLKSLIEVRSERFIKDKK